jgi:hypothetical protein
MQGVSRLDLNSKLKLTVFFRKEFEKVDIKNLCEKVVFLFF